MNYTNEQIDDLLNDIYNGKVDARNLPEDLYTAIATHLEGGVYKGFGGDLNTIKLGTPDHELLSTLRENVYIFSGAKTYQQVKDMGSMVADSKNFSDFKKKAMSVYDEYNRNWLEAEYNTARGQAHQARQWSEIERSKDTFPYLEYTAVIDSRTSEICKPLDGVVLPVDHPMWKKYTPLNHFNCRCTLLKIDKYTDVKQTSSAKVDSITKELDASVPTEFKMNAGLSGYIFDPKSHPYFKVAPKDKELAKKNFNLPVPEVKSKMFNYDFENMSKGDMEKAVIDMFDKKGLSTRVDLSTLPPKKRAPFMSKLQELMNDYNFKGAGDMTVPIKFQTSNNTYGFVEHSYIGGQYKLSKINFGSTTDVSGRTYREQDAVMGILRSKSKADPDNVNLATLVHEFGHVISIPQRKLVTEVERGFWDKMEKLKFDYEKEIKSITDFSKKYEVHLGEYASTKLEEFMAEGFAEYKLSSNPSKYALQIGKLIDESFKIK